VVDELRTVLGARHHFTSLYSPHTNGIVERTNKSLLAALRPMLWESSTDEDHWPWVLPVCQSTLNMTAHAALGGLAPFTVFTGRPAESPLDVVFPSTTAGVQLVQPSAARVRAVTDQLVADLALYAERVALQRPRVRRARAREAPEDFDIGWFVLLSTAAVSTHHRCKLAPKWLGPYVVVACGEDPHTYDVRALTSGEVTRVHSQFLRMYHDPSLTVSEQLLAHEQYAGFGDVIVAIVDHYLLDAHPEDNQLCVLYQSDSAGDGKWEPLYRVLQDAPRLVRSYIARVQDPVQRAKLTALLPASDKRVTRGRQAKK
jgi:hypothetical protein